MYTSDGFKTALPWLILIIGISLFSYGTFGTFEVNSNWKIYISGLGTTLIASGVFAVLLKSMQFMGVFKEELVKIIYEPDYLKNRKDILEIWERVSKVVFKDKFPKISKEITKDVSSLYFPTEHVLYYDNYQQNIEIELVDDEKEIVKVIQHTKFTAFPKDSKIKFDHVTNNTILFLKDKNEVKFNIIDFKVNEINTTPAITELVDKNKLRTTFKVELCGSEEYRVETKIEKSYTLKSDNIIGFMKDYLIHNFQLKVYLKGDLNITFIPAGTLKKFTTNSFRNNTCFEYNYKGIIYPKQGYIIQIEKKQTK
jgi:hypothetical protein